MDNFLKDRRLELDLTLEDVGNHCGVGKSTVRKWENGMINDMGRSKIQRLAEILHVSPLSIIRIGEDVDNIIETVPIDAGVKIPVMRRVAAIYGKEAVEEIIDYIEISPELSAKGDFFGLVVKGDSMIPDIHEGDTVIVQMESDAESGDLIIALVNGSDATCKRLQKYDDGIALIPLNPIYEPLRFTRSEIDDTPVKILGKVVELRRKF